MYYQLDQCDYPPHNFILYHPCPPWCLRQFRGRHISIIGKVLQNDRPKLLQFQVDPKYEKSILVEVEPFEFTFLFDRKQFEGISENSNYGQFQQQLFPSKKREREREKSQQWFFMKKQDIPKSTATVEEIEETSEPVKMITQKYFTKYNCYEIRGKLTQNLTLILHQFTNMGQDFNLQYHNDIMRQAVIHLDKDIYGKIK